MGRELISKKLNEAHIPPMNSDQWWPSVITAMLKNECYVGDLRLQKTFVADHLQKKQLPNRGELPQYLVHDAHEPIINRETFDAVQRLTAIRIAHYHPNRDSSGVTPSAVFSAATSAAAITVAKSPRRERPIPSRCGSAPPII